MNQKLVIAVIEGTSRDKRESIKAARFVAEIGQTYDDVEIVFVDPRDFTFPNDGDGTEGKDPRYTDIVARADAFFIVTPEYNHSYPGGLKRMLDSEYESYQHKPVALAGVSSGNWGGTRAIEGLLPVLRSLGLLVQQYTTYFTRVQDTFDESGTIIPEKQEKYTKSIKSQYDDLIWLAKSLKGGGK